MNLFEATDPEHFAYEPLVIKRVSKETEEASERLYDHVEQLDKKSSLPGWLGAVQTISLLLLWLNIFFVVPYRPTFLNCYLLYHIMERFCKIFNYLLYLSHHIIF